MKLFLVTIFSFLLMSSGLYAQIPQSINYQAIARDGAGDPIVTGTVDLRFTITTGTGSFVEIHPNEPVSSFGLVNVQIGIVNPAGFAAIEWESAPVSITVEVDDGGGYNVIGTQGLQSVPYSFQASVADSVRGIDLSSFKIEPGNGLIESNDSLHLGGVMDKDITLDQNGNDVFLLGDGTAQVGIGTNSVSSLAKMQVENSFGQIAIRAISVGVSNNPTAVYGLANGNGSGSASWDQTGLKGLASHNGASRPIGVYGIAQNTGTSTQHAIGVLGEASTSSTVGYAIGVYGNTVSKGGDFPKYAVYGHAQNITGGTGSLHGGYFRTEGSTVGDSSIAITGVAGTGAGLNLAAYLDGDTYIKGRLRVDDGTQANGYVFTSNASGLGSWAPAPSSPWTVNGSDVYRAGGKVGIGTNAPGVPLHLLAGPNSISRPTGVMLDINQTLTDHRAYLRFSQDGASLQNPFYIGTDFDNGINEIWDEDGMPLSFGVGNSERMRIDASGSVNIGRSTAINTSTVLTVEKNVAGTGYGGMYVGTTSATGRPFYGFTLNGASTSFFYFDGSNDRMNYYDGGDRLTITGAGNVGIGQVAPIAKLDVNGSINLTGEVNRASTGTANMVPVAYGKINASGAILSATSNVTGVVWNAINSFYEVTIAGESINSTSYISLSTVHGCSSCSYNSTTSSVSNKLVVIVFNDSNSKIQNAFSFVVYKP